MTFRDGMIRRTAFPAVLFALLLVPTLSGGSAPQRGPRSPPRFVDSGQALGDSRVFRVAPGDFDGDGDPDVLVVDFHGPTHLWTNDGRGRFTDTGQLLGETGGHGAAVGDLDGDSDLDVYLVHNGRPDRVFLNDGHGVLMDSGQRLGGQEEWGTTAVLGDVDGDGDLDAYVTVFQGPGHLWINDGSGRFTDSGRSLDGTPTSVAFGDVDGDGDLDAVVAYPRSEDRVWFNDGTGRLGDSGQRLGPVVGWGFVELGDLDADGDVDALVTNSEMGNRVWFNDGGGAFSLSAEYFGTGSRAALGDLDGDGALDVMAISEGAARRSCTVWLNGGRGDFTGSGTRLDITGVLSLALADVDDDGDLDAVLGRMEERGGNRVFLNDPPRPARGVRPREVRHELVDGRGLLHEHQVPRPSDPPHGRTLD